MTDRAHPPQRRDVRGALAVYAVAMGACVILAHALGGLPIIASHLGTLIAGIFLYLPTGLILRRGESFSAYGLTVRPLGRGLLFFLAATAIVLPLYSVGLFGYLATVCAGAQGRAVLLSAYRTACGQFARFRRRPALRVPVEFGQSVLAQLVIGLSEEYFFRGYLQSRLDRAWPPRRRLWGAPLGPSVIVVSALFALGHVLVEVHPARLAVFFPSLIFGWLRQATGSILAGSLFHATCNVWNAVLYASLFPLHR